MAAPALSPFCFPGGLSGRLAGWLRLESRHHTWLSLRPVLIAMTFYELIWQGEGCGDAADLEEALTHFQELRPKAMSWQEVCADPAYSPTIRRYRSFEAYLDNEDEIETIHPTPEMLERFASDGAEEADGSVSA